MTETSKPSSIAIKGIREGLLAYLGEGEWREIKASLLRQVSEGNSFFSGAKLALDVGSRELRAVELGALRDELSERGVALWAVISSSTITETTAQVLGMATRLGKPAADRIIRTFDTNLKGEEAVLVQRTLRSGFRLTSEGHVVVIGDVNPGAEIEANGSIVIWGHLRGSVHAGAEGDDTAIICALLMAPTQLRIANILEGNYRSHHKNQPETAFLQLGKIVRESWKS